MKGAMNVQTASSDLKAILRAYAPGAAELESIRRSLLPYEPVVEPSPRLDRRAEREEKRT
jgi:hypothetical protein